MSAILYFSVSFAIFKLALILDNYIAYSVAKGIISCSEGFPKDFFWSEMNLVLANNDITFMEW